MKKLTRPEPFCKGDRIAILGGSSPTDKTPEVLSDAARKFGLEPVIYPSATARYGFLSGVDQMRADDINRAFEDDSIKGIVATRGGYGSHRIMPLLDWETISRHPKFFGGYSDVTAFLVGLNQLGGMEAYHMPMVGAWAGHMDAYTESYVKAMLFGEKPDYTNPSGKSVMCVQRGKAKGQLIGGNMSLLTASLGTPYEVDTKGKILFIEELNESPYKVDGMMTHLRNAGKFDDCAGIIFGQFLHCEGDEEDRKTDLSFDQIVYDLVVPSGKPIIKGVMCGHDTPTMALPMGRIFELDADACRFQEAE